MAKRKKKNYGALITKMAVALFAITVIGVGVLAVIIYTNNNQENTADTSEVVDVSSVSSTLDLSVSQKSGKEITETNTIYDNIFIENVDVGGLTKEAAIQKLEEELQKPVDEKKITLTHESLQWEISYKQLNAKYEINKAVDNAYKIAREGTEEQRFDKIEELKTTPVMLPIDYTIDSSLAEPIISEIASEVNIPAVNATISREGSAFKTTSEKSGMKLNIGKTQEKVSELVNIKNEGTVALVMEEDVPRYLEQDFKKVGDVIGSFSTKFSLSAVDRNVNLQVASKSINGTFLYPGNVFSTGKAFGPTTAEYGYREATIILNGKYSTDYGGGVCQVSSTLYNAVLFAELGIVQRQSHSKQVTYVPIGRDATLAGDIIDFKFENTTKYPIYIESYISNDKLVVNIYGVEERPSNRTLDFESEVTEKINPPAEQIIEDPTLPVGTRKVDVEAKIGQRAKVYKKIFVNGELVDKVHVNNSYYTPTRAEVRVGTKPVDNTKKETPQDTDGTNINQDGTPTNPIETSPVETDPIETSPTETVPVIPTETVVPAETVPVIPTETVVPAETEPVEVPVVPEPETQTPENTVPEIPDTDNTDTTPPENNEDTSDANSDVTAVFADED